MVRFVSETYLAGVENYEFKMFFEDDAREVVCVKKINKMKEPFVLNEDGNIITILDDGYFVVDVVPFDENYVARIHFDRDKKLIEKFFILTKNNSMQNGVPAYEDLKVSYVCTNFGKKVYGKERFDAFLENGQMTKDEHEYLSAKFDKLKKSVDCGENFIYNSNYEKYLF